MFISGINRIRLEFKVDPGYDFILFFGRVLIESDWNLKQFSLFSDLSEAQY